MKMLENIKKLNKHVLKASLVAVGLIVGAADGCSMCAGEGSSKPKITLTAENPELKAVGNGKTVKAKFKVKVEDAPCTTSDYKFKLVGKHYKENDYTTDEADANKHASLKDLDGKSLKDITKKDKIEKDKQESFEIDLVAVSAAKGSSIFEIKILDIKDNDKEVTKAEQKYTVA